MADRLNQRELTTMAARAYRGRSDLYRYIRANHADLISQGVGTAKGPSWADLAVVIAGAGQVNRKGMQPTPDSIRRIFATVSRDLAAEAAERAVARSPILPPSRGRPTPNWTPTEVPQGARNLGSPPSGSVSTAANEADPNARAEANLADLRATVAHRSGQTPIKKGAK
jgi:hypothetical protein